jgi:hypothetical protein
MPPEVYIFGYQSMLAQGSVASSIGATVDYVPARLEDHIREWNAVRDFTTNPRKRYVHSADWQPTGRVAFANLIKQPTGRVNGLCHRIPADRLDELDFREQGYVRLEVTKKMAAYPGYTLAPGIPVYAYIDPAPASIQAPVSRAYYTMGRDGARSVAAQVAGFSADYLSSTRQPLLADDLVFLFIGADGRHLWLLEETDSSLVLLLRFAHPQFAGAGDSATELARPITPALDWLDLRTPRNHARPHPRIPPAMAGELTGHCDPAALSRSPFWLSRLTAIESRCLDLARLESLSNDPDPWVRRAALQHLGVDR